MLFFRICKKCFVVCCERACSCSTFHFFRVCACFFLFATYFNDFVTFFALTFTRISSIVLEFFFAIENVINRAQIQIVVMMFWLVLLPPYGFRV